MLPEFAQRLQRIQERAGRAHASDVAQDIAQRAAELLLRELQAKGGRLGVSIEVAFGRHQKNTRIKSTVGASDRIRKTRSRMVTFGVDPRLLPRLGCGQKTAKFQATVTGNIFCDGYVDFHLSDTGSYWSQGPFGCLNPI